MNDIKQIEDHKAFWKRSTMEIITFTEGTLADILQLARKDILSLITTIESQKEEIKRLQWAASNAFDNLNQLKSADVEEAKQFLYKALTDSSSFTQDIASLKAITELAVKGLKKIGMHGAVYQYAIVAGMVDSILLEIEKLQDAQT